MSSEGSLFTFYTLTPFHAGAGESSGAIDLPIQREKHTEYPVAYSSGLKGSLRYLFQTKKVASEAIDSIFGKEGLESGAGSIVFNDARILLFPCRSSQGVFKWAIAPFVLERLARDLAFIGKRHPLEIPSITNDGVAYSLEQSGLLMLEDFQVNCQVLGNADPLGGLLEKLLKPHLTIPSCPWKERVVVVSDNVFKTLVTTATQVIARNQLVDNKKSNNLWYEEVVPADAVFYTVMLPVSRSAAEGIPGSDESSPMGEIRNILSNTIVQIGGNESVGFGFVNLSYIELGA
jgi:CRISPR-associated protein Cmr4